jgi:hypothetical protein
VMRRLQRVLQLTDVLSITVTAQPGEEIRELGHESIGCRTRGHKKSVVLTELQLSGAKLV